MSRRLAPGTNCTVGGRPGVVQGGVGSGDYIVKLSDGRRVTSNIREISVTEDAHASATHVPVITPSDTPGGDAPPKLGDKPLPPVIEDDPDEDKETEEDLVDDDE